MQAPVSIVVPAYNEAAVILTSVRSVRTDEGGDDFLDGNLDIALVRHRQPRRRPPTAARKIQDRPPVGEIIIGLIAFGGFARGRWY